MCEADEILEDTPLRAMVAMGKRPLEEISQNDLNPDKMNKNVNKKNKKSTNVSQYFG